MGSDDEPDPSAFALPDHPSILLPPRSRSNERVVRTDGLLDVDGSDLALGESALHVGGQPDLCERALAAEDGVRVEHGAMRMG